jgi:hypothetical protein
VSNNFGFNNEFIFGFESSSGQNRVREPLQGPNVIDGIVQQDGFNTYQISYEPMENTLEVYCDGLLLREGADRDYIVNGTNIVFTVSPDMGVSLEAKYIKV